MCDRADLYFPSSLLPTAWCCFKKLFSWERSKKKLQARDADLQKCDPELTLPVPKSAGLEMPQCLKNFINLAMHAEIWLRMGKKIRSQMILHLLHPLFHPCLPTSVIAQKTMPLSSSSPEWIKQDISQPTRFLWHRGRSLSTTVHYTQTFPQLLILWYNPILCMIILQLARHQTVAAG